MAKNNEKFFTQSTKYLLQSLKQNDDGQYLTQSPTSTGRDLEFIKLIRRVKGRVVFILNVRLDTIQSSIQFILSQVTRHR